MKNIKFILAIASFLFFAQVQTQTLYNNVGHIPTAYQETWNVAGLLQDFSSTTADSVFMITGSADNDYPEVSTALTNAKTFIGSSNKLAIIYFPEGTYHFDSPITLDSTYRNIIFQGAGSDRTTLVFRNMRNSHCFVLQGTTTEGPIALEHDCDKGENRIYPASSSWATGQWIHFFVYNYDYRADVIEEKEIVGQVTRIDSLGTDGNGYFLQIKDKADMNYLHLPGDGRPMRVYKISPIQNIGIEDLKIMRSPHENAFGSAHPYNINIDCAVNCWVRGVESYKPSCHHLNISRSSQCEVSGCYFHEAMDYCGGGWGYGVQLYQSTTNCLIENNIFRSLRHSLVAAAGSNCNVWTFNYSREQLYTIVGDPLDDPTYRDLDLHAKWPFGHLFEQNLIEEIGADGNDDNGANGFYNTFVRNYCYDQDVITIEKMENWSFVGNIKDDFDDKKALRYDADWNPIIDLFGFRNGYTTPCTHLSNYLYGYTCQLADVSYYYSSRPDFLSLEYSWPALGPEINLTQNIPAHTRFGYDKKTCLARPTPKPLTTTGTIPYTQTWSANHTVTGNITIPSGLTLTIKSGVTVTFSGSSYITVQPGGTIIAESGVVFSPSDRSVRCRGAMSTDNSWGFPVLVDSTLTVGSGKWLTILPGTTVRVNSGHKIKVDGKLAANGSSGLPITFTSASGTWAGIDLYCADASSMSYCTVQNASTGVRAYQTDLTLDHCTFSSNSYSAVTFENQASGTITHSIFSGNATYAIRCLQYSNPVIRPVNRIWNNYGTAVSGDGSSLPDLGSYYNYGNNSIKNNYPDDIWSDNINTVYAQHNYWGSSSPEPYVSDNVEWEPYLSSDPTGSLGKALAGQEVAAILHEKPSADTTGKQLFGKAYQAWIEGDTDAAGMQFEQLAQECPSSPAGLQALSMAVRCYDRNKDSDGAGSYLEKIIKEKSTSVISELAMSIKVGRLARLGKYDEAAGAAEQLLNSATDETLRKYALYDLATLLYHFLNDKQNGEKYYRQLLAEYPDDPLAEVAASVLGQSVDPPIEEKLAKASTLPTEYELLQNYPNPFNPETRIQFTLPEAAQVRIEVMNVLGQRIAVLCDGSMAADHHTVRWDGRTASGEKAGSGVYFCRLQAGGFIKTIKMMLLP